MQYVEEEGYGQNVWNCIVFHKRHASIKNNLVTKGLISLDNLDLAVER